MADEFAVVASAFVGGLAGALLQPLASYGLDILSRRRDIERNRERQLRKMVEYGLARGRALAAASVQRFVSEERGQEPPYDEMMRRVKIAEDFLWQPKRISDLELRKACERHNELCNILFLSTFKPDFAEAQRHRARAELHDLKDYIVERMDQLNWPDAESP